MCGELKQLFLQKEEKCRLKYSDVCKYADEIVYKILRSVQEAVDLYEKRMQAVRHAILFDGRINTRYVGKYAPRRGCGRGHNKKWTATSPTNRNRLYGGDRLRGGDSFEEYGCITSASELSKRSIGCMISVKMHDYIVYVSDVLRLLDYEVYKPLYDKKNARQKPYWYSALSLTDRGKRYLEVYSSLLESIGFNL